ncbi:MAG: aminotransferase class III-fold pyridoxal phosphate-dependent enzyme, partial [Hyphomicrobiales bacterium]|nr:aminotransferase class III-fold pyridoxal phosphate-dependent enzyme [Hyphomicrobiales bacterium]
LDTLRRVRDLCDANGVLLIFDEVQCGMGRTGRLFAHEWAGIAPDIMMLAKGLGGGFPIGAVLATERVARHMTPGSHGSTFGGNPLATAMANAVLDVVTEPGFLEEADRIGRMLRDRLEGFVARHGDVVSEVRGAGLLLGLKCVPPAAACVDAVRETGMLTHTAGDNVLRLMPPLTIREQHVEEAIEHLEQAASTLAERTDAA